MNAYLIWEKTVPDRKINLPLDLPAEFKKGTAPPGVVP